MVRSNRLVEAGEIPGPHRAFGPKRLLMRAAHHPLFPEKLWTLTSSENRYVTDDAGAPVPCNYAPALHTARFSDRPPPHGPTGTVAACASARPRR